MPARKPHDQFVKELTAIFPDFFDNYEIIGKYRCENKKIRIKDKYGELDVLPSSLISQKSLPSIQSAVNKTEYFANQANEVFGELYDYSESKYLGKTKPFSFICKTCGHKTTLSQARLHLEKHRGCDICGVNHPKNQNKDVFLKRLKTKTHKFDNYDFSKFEYLGSQIKSTVICDLGHEYQATPNTMLFNTGCPECFRLKSLGRIVSDSTKNMITGRPANILKETEVDDLLNRNIFIKKNEYKNTNSQIKATCLICGHKWMVRYSSLKNGTGCPECAKESIRDTLRMPFDEAVSRAIKLYGNNYFYVRTSYISYNKPMTIVCREHGPFRTSMENHCRKIRPQLCKKCHPTVFGFDQNKTAILYSIDLGGLFKIGITNRTVENRYSLKDQEKFINIRKIKLSGSDAFAKEKELKRKYKKFRYIGPNILDSGNSEIFTVDIFSLENLR